MIPFQAFDYHAPFSIYWSRLPHWRQAGRTYFVTFRLGDSLPKTATDFLKEMRTIWLKARGIDPAHKDYQTRYLKLAEKERRLFEREFSSKMNHYLDAGHGGCALREPRCIAEVRESLMKFDGIRYDIGDFVIMPNHVHCLITPRKDQPLEKLLGGIKNGSSRRIGEFRDQGNTFPFWQRDSFDHIVRSWEQLEKFQRYIADNPKKAGITLPPECTHSAVYGRHSADHS